MSSIDTEIRSLNDTNELAQFLAMLIAVLQTRRNFDLVQSYMATFLNIHYEALWDNNSKIKHEKMDEIEQEQQRNAQELVTKVCYNKKNIIKDLTEYKEIIGATKADTRRCSASIWSKHVIGRIYQKRIDNVIFLSFFLLIFLLNLNKMEKLVIFYFTHIAISVIHAVGLSFGHR